MVRKTLFILIALLVPASLVHGEAYTIQVKSGPESKLPGALAVGEPAMTTDTHRVFFGTGNGKVELLSTPIVQRAGEPADAPKLQILDSTGKVRMTIDATGALTIK